MASPRWHAWRRPLTGSPHDKQASFVRCRRAQPSPQRQAHSHRGWVAQTVRSLLYPPPHTRCSGSSGVVTEPPVAVSVEVATVRGDTPRTGQRLVGCPCRTWVEEPLSRAHHQVPAGEADSMGQRLASATAGLSPRRRSTVTSAYSVRWPTRRATWDSPGCNSAPVSTRSFTSSRTGTDTGRRTPLLTVALWMKGEVAAAEARLEADRFTVRSARAQGSGAATRCARARDQRRFLGTSRGLASATPSMRSPRGCERAWRSTPKARQRTGVRNRTSGAGDRSQLT